MTDLNTAIAKYKGWEYFQNINLWELVVDGYTRLQSDNPPDFENDARLYMALFEEMSSGFFLLSLMQHDYDNKTIITGDYRQGHNENIPQFVVESQPIGTAICLAYCKLKGLKS